MPPPGRCRVRGCSVEPPLAKIRENKNALKIPEKGKKGDEEEEEEEGEGEEAEEEEGEEEGESKKGKGVEKVREVEGGRRGKKKRGGGRCSKMFSLRTYTSLKDDDDTLNGEFPGPVM
ncbi:hypothetical protein Pcinc_042661 [Petrolisthes cinctipes]|uniref:Uncharacterized protein n=1 Tax=Petrolisthes cinctipes TaxID=88211 RepID=A0AAE1EIK9_PETCI|nr:hypothetical protein Pcinc_042661 [Petrolisthes cinctipes]